MMKIRSYPLALCFCAFIACGGSDHPAESVDIACTPKELSTDYQGATLQLEVSCSNDWLVYSDASWITCTKDATSASDNVSVKVGSNSSYSDREGTVVVKSGSTREYIPVKQTGRPELPVDPSITVPEGYRLMWQDEFDDASLSMPDESLWWYEVWEPGHVNNELQRYVKGKQGDDVTAEVSDGTLKLHAIKAGDEVISARINTIESWKYGYFEARLKLPVGKGAWPAFWMMPKNYTVWPDDGEIDIMEEVGYSPNYVSSSIHCKAYYHSIGTQKTKEILVPTAQNEFHVYALEWTEEYIRTYVDGKELLYFANDNTGNKDKWPFNTAFYLKLNLAWGGDWGGAQGVDESMLPATYEIDYVRVFQKE